MWLTNKLTTETGGIGFLPTSIGYHRKITKQNEMMAAQKKAWEAQQAKIREGKLRVKALESDLWWDELSTDEKKHARTICIIFGYPEALEFVKREGMARHRSPARKSSLTGISTT